MKPILKRINEGFLNGMDMCIDFTHLDCTIEDIQAVSKYWQKHLWYKPISVLFVCFFNHSYALHFPAFCGNIVFLVG